METALIKLGAVIAGNYGGVGLLVFALVCVLGFGAWKCSADAAKREAWAREDIEKMVAAISELRRVQTRLVENSIAIMEAIRRG